MNKTTSFGLNKSGLKISFLNVRNLLSKIDEVKQLATEKCNTHIFGLCETFLTKEVSEDLIEIEGFYLERKDRCETQDKSGGGIVAYISNSLNYKRRKDLELSNLENIWIQLEFKNTKSVLVCFVYRPPGMPQSWIDSFETEIDYANDNGLEIMIFGDLNIDYTDGCTNTKWEHVVTQSSLTQIIDTPTRVTSTSSSIIDHVYVNHPENIIEINVPKIALSDHYPICVTRKINKKDCPNGTHKTIEYRCFKKFNEESFLEELKELNLDQIEYINDTEAAIEMWYTLFLSLINKHAPLKTKRVKYSHQPGWMTDEIKDAQRKRDYLIIIRKREIGQIFDCLEINAKT